MLGSSPRVRSAPARALALAAASALSLLLQDGCKSDEPAARASRRGEVCQVASDCEDGLFCAPMPGGGSGGICVTGNFKITKTAKTCALVECAAPADCCDASLEAQCQQLRIQCFADESADAGSSAACDLYASECGCDTGTVDCDHGKCISRCTDNAGCSGAAGGRRCVGGVCVQCASDDNCSPDQRCVTGKCQALCTNDGACTGFDRCVAGRCIPSGCQADRECVAATRNVDARCGTDGKCIVPCETDLECGSPTSYAFFSCIDRRCTYVGCESDKDCRLFLTGPSDTSTLPPRQTAVCRDDDTLGAVVPPSP